jgi:alanine-glyoxylate transaminase / serine-glyoxylate transaminase / serine-pyruvate transaminase
LISERGVLRPSPIATLAPQSGRANSRLSLISRHFDQRLTLPLPELNTPFSSERLSVEVDDIEYNPIERPLLTFPGTVSSSEKASKQKNIKMSSQAAHNTLLIPGPIEFDDGVLQSMSHYG